MFVAAGFEEVLGAGFVAEPAVLGVNVLRIDAMSLRNMSDESPTASRFHRIGNHVREPVYKA